MRYHRPDALESPFCFWRAAVSLALFVAVAVAARYVTSNP